MSACDQYTIQSFLNICLPCSLKRFQEGIEVCHQWLEIYPFSLGSQFYRVSLGGYISFQQLSYILPRASECSTLSQCVGISAESSATRMHRSMGETAMIDAVQGVPGHWSDLGGISKKYR